VTKIKQFAENESKEHIKISYTVFLQLLIHNTTKITKRKWWNFLRFVCWVISSPNKAFSRKKIGNVSNFAFSVSFCMVSWNLVILLIITCSFLFLYFIQLTYESMMKWIENNSYHIESREWFAKTRESHFSVLHLTILFCRHFPLCFRCITLYYTLAVTFCFTGFCKPLYCRLVQYSNISTVPIGLWMAYCTMKTLLEIAIYLHTPNCKNTVLRFRELGS